MAVARSNPPLLTKTELAKKIGVSRSSLYYKHKMPERDKEVKAQIESVLSNHPSYGHKRIAIALKLNKKRILRVMKKFGIKPYRRRVKKPVKKNDLNKLPSKIKNNIKNFCPISPNVVWASDFTYIKYDSKFIYLATIIDIYTREIVGWNISRFHNKELVLGALEDAIRRQGGKTPTYLHSDQGSEYVSQLYQQTAKKLNIILSMSKKGSPWENGHQESFYSNFKLDLGRTDRFSELGELIAAIHETMNKYNKTRIHSKLKMSPIKFKKQYYKKLFTDNASRKKGTWHW